MPVTQQALADELRERLSTAALGGPTRSRERHIARGKMLPRDRVHRLLDESSPFIEVAPLAAHGLYGDEAPGAGVIAGIGLVHGRHVMVVCNDPTVKGGTYFPLTVKKHLRAQEIALENRLPCLYLVDSGGAFLPKQDEVFPDRDHFGRIFFNQARMSAEGIPQLAAVLGSCTAGGAYVPAMSDQTVIVREQGTIFLGGPPLVKAAIGEVVTAEELGGGELHARRSGVVDHLAEDDEHALEILRDIVATLPRPADPAWSVAPSVAPSAKGSLYDVVPVDVNASYDVHEVIDRLVDGDTVSEFKPEYGTTLVTAFARLHGHPVGIVANNGVLFSESAQKGAHFIELCDQRHPSAVPAEHHRVHGRHRRRSGRHRQGRREDGDRRRHHTRAQAHRHHRRLVRRRQLLDVRASVLAAVPVELARQPHLGDGRAAGGVSPRDGEGGSARRSRHAVDCRAACRVRGTRAQPVRGSGRAVLRHCAAVG